MRILIFHGYLLAGTGSNVYNARLAEALVRLGHEVHLFTQDRHPERQSFVDAAGDWDGGQLALRVLREPVRCTTYRPDIGALLPVYVADRYEGLEARMFGECSDAEIEDYVAANVRAVSEVAELARPDVALANHLVMGPLILARALDDVVPYAVKIHGSALEYTVKASPQRFLPAAQEGTEGARGVLVGSWHTASSLWKALGDPALVERTRLGPPGVDVKRFRPREEHSEGGGEQGGDHAASSQRLVQLLGKRLLAQAASELAERPRDAFARDELAALRALEEVEVRSERLVAFVGKLIVSKGVDLLIAAWPLVLERFPEARLLIVGFGSYRAGLERLIGAIARGDLDAAVEIANRGRGLEAESGEEGPPLRYLLAFLQSLSGERRERYLEAARGLVARTTLTGRLEHDELALLLPACEAVVVPSTFPESFGMITVEAAACGAFPVSAAHSGLAEVSSVLARGLPQPAAPWLSFPLDEHAVETVADRVSAWLGAADELREQTRAALVATVREHYSWEGVARGVLAAARGELGLLEAPRAAGTFG